MSTEIRTQADVERIMAERNISFVFRPIVTPRGDGSWVAQYPGADWSVTGTDEDDARQKLRAAELAQMQHPGGQGWKVAAVREHLTRGPIPGVYELDNATADRVQQAGTPDALEAALADIESQRGSS